MNGRENRGFSQHTKWRIALALGRGLDTGRRHVDHGDVAAVVCVHGLGDGVVDRDVVELGLQYRAVTPRLHTADGVAS